MRRFANVYIALFLIDAGFSLADELLAISGATSSLFSSGRQVVALLVVAAHHENISRLQAGTEHRLGDAEPDPKDRGTPGRGEVG